MLALPIITDLMDHTDYVLLQKAKAVMWNFLKLETEKSTFDLRYKCCSQFGIENLRLMHTYMKGFHCTSFFTESLTITGLHICGDLRCS
jgi:hypothetical protein